MKAAVFNELIKEIGESILVPVGFKFSYGTFNYESDAYCLVFKSSANRGVDLYGRLVSLHLRHPGYEVEDFRNKGKWRFSTPYYPAKIAPTHLRKWASGDVQYSMRDSLLKNVNYMNRKTYEGIYYGGPEEIKDMMNPENPYKYNENILSEKDAEKRVLGRASHLLGLDYADDESCSRHLTEMMETVAAHCHDWAQFWTPVRLLDSLKKSKVSIDQWYYERWYKAYQRAENE